jgi:hypothetical protein
MIEVVKYTKEYQVAWDSFVSSAKNGAFLFQRAYQEYHADRFTDHSYLLQRDGQLLALFPASRHGDEVVSHGGLTFGGILSDDRMTTPLMLEIFSALLTGLRSDGIQRLVYKASPSIYHRIPAGEDLYALTRNGARLFRREVGSILCPAFHPEFQERRRRSIKKANKAGVIFRETEDFSTYWRILEETLHARHGTAPVHSLSEMLLLRSRFAAGIRLFCAYDKSELLAGTIVYENPTVAHTQYLACSMQGREVGALDFVLSELITRIYANKPWFSFGISTESGGTVLNQGLIDQKEGFGARACVQDCYELLI